MAEEMSFGISSRTQRDVYFWGSKSDGPITKEMCEDAQVKLGFHPMGYGFYHFFTSGDAETGYTANWSCAGSCD